MAYGARAAAVNRKSPAADPPVRRAGRGAVCGVLGGRGGHCHRGGCVEWPERRFILDTAEEGTRVAGGACRVRALHLR